MENKRDQRMQMWRGTRQSAPTAGGTPTRNVKETLTSLEK